MTTSMPLPHTARPEPTGRLRRSAIALAATAVVGAVALGGAQIADLGTDAPTASTAVTSAVPYEVIHPAEAAFLAGLDHTSTAPTSSAWLDPAELRFLTGQTTSAADTSVDCAVTVPC